MSSSSQAVRVLGLLVVLSAGTGLTPVAAREITDQRWQAVECPFSVSKEFVVGEDVICGTVAVPQRHAEPDGANITLSVAVFRALGPSPAPDPLVLFTGGPGGNIFDLAPKERSGMGGSIMNQRDIVLMSERGTFGAEPMLDCPELSALDDHFGVWGGARDALELEAYTRCRQRLVEEGVDLASFNNAERADDLFIAVLTNSFGMIGLVPKMICDTARGDYDLISVFLPGAFAGDTGISTADGLYLSMICPEIGEMAMDEVATDGAYPEIVRTMASRVRLFFDLCSVWDVPVVPPGEIVAGDVPALIMEGAFDTNQPPEYGAEVAANLSTAYVVEFGDKAHVTLGECGLAMMTQFMSDPTRRPDTTCVATRPSFSSPAGPLWWIVYNNLPWFIAGVALVVLLVIGGTVWLVRRRRASIRLAVAGR
jgi:pimeloyl-ACP methyl ester carboxylesterase